MNTIEWAGGNDYSIGRVAGKERFYIQRYGPVWLGLDWKGASNDPIARGATMRVAQAQAEDYYATEASDAGT